MWTHNPKVEGSNPSPATIPIAWLVSAPSSLPPDLILEVTSTFPSNYATTAYGRKQTLGLSLNHRSFTSALGKADIQSSDSKMDSKSIYK